ncbi:hypothetical protein EON81_01390 [bacterium]|nr:MAG: hypothetical protein EON81_01390 [bacterium]
MVAAVHFLNLLLSTNVTEVPKNPMVEVPIEKSPAQIVIRMKIDGKEGRFALDTGSFEVRIQRTSAERLGLVPVTPPDQRFIYDKVQQWLDPVLEIGGVSFGKQDLVVKPMYFDTSGNSIDYAEYDGTVGTEFMRQHAWGFDLVNKKITIWKGGKVSPKDSAFWVGQGATTANLKSGGPEDWFRLEGALNGKPITFVLDTGAPFSLVMKDKEDAYGFSAIGNSNLMFLDGSRPGTVGLGTTMDTPWRKRNLPLAALIEHANFPLFDQLKTDAVVGYDSFSDTLTLFDFPGLKLTTRSDADRVAWSNHLGSFGFRLTVSNGKPGVLVKPGSKAEKAGLKTGDLLDEIDGVPTTTDTERTPPSGWESRPTIHLKVRRGDETLDLTIERELVPTG